MFLVTGASGLLGANLALQLVRRGEKVAAIFRQNPIRIQRAEVLRADLADGDVVAGLIGRLRPTWIIHCAALTNVDYCEAHPGDARRINTEMSQHLASEASLIRARMVYISTDSVFDGQKGLYSEDDVPDPVNVYAKSKLDGEMVVRNELPNALVVRTCIYGWNACERESLAEWILNRLRSRQHISGFCDVTFSPILANDLSNVLLDMVDRELTGLYHVSGSEPCSKYDFALRLAGVFDLDSALVERSSIRESDLMTARPRNTSLRTDKVEQILGKQMPDLNSGLRDFRRLLESGFAKQLKALGER